MAFVRVVILILVLLTGWASVRAQPALMHALRDSVALVVG